MRKEEEEGPTYHAFCSSSIFIRVVPLEVRPGADAYTTQLIMLRWLENVARA